jgi:hypothetical protein
VVRRMSRAKPRVKTPYLWTVTVTERTSFVVAAHSEESAEELALEQEWDPEEVEVVNVAVERLQPEP